MNSLSHIAIVCSRLDLPGGIERAIVNTANLFIDKGHAVSLIILDETSSSFYPLNNLVKIVQTNINFGLTTKGNVVSRKIDFIKHLQKFKRIIDQVLPDVMITTEYVFSITTRLATKKIKILSWEHHHFYWLKKSMFWNFLFYKLYPKLDKIICLNDVESKLFQKIGCKTTVIENFIVHSNKRSSLQAKTLLTVGWLIKRKGVDLIPKIAEEVCRKYPDWKWKIIGEGEELNYLQKEIHSKNLEEHIEIVKPASHDISQEYLSASVYIMTSRFECFPMVLLEAMSFGVPSISFNCPTGPEDIITDNEDGILIETENITAMSNAISDLISNEDKRMAFGLKAQQNIERYSPDAIYKKWLAEF